MAFVGLEIMDQVHPAMIVLRGHGSIQAAWDVCNVLRSCMLRKAGLESGVLGSWSLGSLDR